MLTLCVCVCASPHSRVSEVTSSLERLKAQNAEKASAIEVLAQKLEAKVSKGMVRPER